jgi:hypothetical protein
VSELELWIAGRAETPAEFYDELRSEGHFTWYIDQSSWRITSMSGGFYGNDFHRETIATVEDAPCANGCGRAAVVYDWNNHRYTYAFCGARCRQQWHRIHRTGLKFRFSELPGGE